MSILTAGTAIAGDSATKDATDRYYGLRDFTIVDPDGFGIRFASPVR